jgi:thioredoxin reductase (NADPH)
MVDMIYDIAIVGCGPAGMSAAICATLRNKSVLVLGSAFCSRKMHQAPTIENYLGFEKISGKDLREKFIAHMDSLSIKVLDSRITSIYPDPDGYSLFSTEQAYKANSVILATGVSQNITLQGETDYVGKGVSYCATCDGPLYKGKSVAVISGINEGEHEANYLSEICRKVFYIPRYKEVGQLNSKIEVVNSVPKRIDGQQTVEHLITNDAILDINAVFLIYDATPAERLIQGLNMDTIHVNVNRLMETNLPGLFAAGDCIGKPYQLAKAVGEGQIAALSAVEYLTRNNKNHS